MSVPLGNAPTPPPPSLSPAVASSSGSVGATSAGPPRLVNLYNVRTVATPKQCFVCHRETTTCLATDGVTDFLYTCRHHLLDPGFARPAPASGAATPASSAPACPTTATTTVTSSVTQSEIDKVKKEYEEKQKRKEAGDSSSAAKDAPKEAGGGPASTAFALFKTGASAISSLSSQATSTLFPPPPPAEPSPSEQARAAAQHAKVFVLQKDFFRMRVDKKRKEWEKKDAEARGATWSFPKAPRGAVGVNHGNGS